MKFVAFLIIYWVFAVQLVGAQVLGTKLIIPHSKIRVQVDADIYKSLPETLNWYDIVPRKITDSDLQWIIGVGRLAEHAQVIQSNASHTVTGRHVLLQTTNLSLTTFNGSIVFRRHVDGKASTNSLVSAIEPDALQAELRSLMKAFKIQEQHVEKALDGSFRMQISDRERYPNRQVEPVVVERTVTVFRQMDGCPLLFEGGMIRLSRLRSGELSDVAIYWPEFKPKGVCNRSFRSNAELAVRLARSDVIWGASNEMEQEEINRVVIREIGLGFKKASVGEILEPVWILSADITASSGEVEGVLFLPACDLQQ